KVLVDMPPNQMAFHLGGALAFGTDGKLYFSTGEHVGVDPQSLQDPAGKIFRFNADGSVPDDDPHVATGSGVMRAVWARGFRAPFTMAVEPSTGRLFVSEVGDSKFEEVDEIVKDGNYGWPLSEGPTTTPGQTGPIFSYGHDQGCAIVGGAFGPRGYSFMDYCKGWIRAFDPNTKQVVDLGHAGGKGPVAIASAGGKLYYVTRGSTDLDGGSGPGYETGKLFELDPTVSATPTGS
ncbi:MAG TPA: PQQ-dependent sugar dehydrogenase, partial [Acidimicrobiales bacterium]|nr:PQQ-dependent sugar dehydrogenase [Acidimicrobiales bacterium]